jgi:hypothetical protein
MIPPAPIPIKTNHYTREFFSPMAASFMYWVHCRRTNCSNFQPTLPSVCRCRDHYMVAPKPHFHGLTDSYVDFVLREIQELNQLSVFFFSVAEPVHFCAAPAPACQKLWLLLRLLLRPFSPYILEKIKKLSLFQKFCCFLKI